MFTVTPKQAAIEIADCLTEGLVPFLVSSPGMGKSSLVHQFAKENRLMVIDCRLGQYLPEDLNGLPKITGEKASFIPFDTFPTEEDKIPEGYQGWLIFLDELTSASKPVQAAAYKLILDKMVGSKNLHPAVAMVAAGNKKSDKAVVNTMSTALQSRVIHFELELDQDEFFELMLEKDFDHRVRAFLYHKPSKIMDFRPDHTENTFACPRTWEFNSKLIKGRPVDESKGPRIAGAIGEGTAAEFITFCKVYKDIPKFSDVVADPANARLPEEGTAKWATVSMLIDHFDEHTLDKAITYVQRFTIEFQIIFARGVCTVRPELRSTHQDFISYARQMARYLG